MRLFPRSPNETLATLWRQAEDSTNPLVRVIADQLFQVEDCRVLRAGGNNPQYRAEPPNVAMLYVEPTSLRITETFEMVLPPISSISDVPLYDASSM